MISSVAPVSAPLKAWNGEPGSTLIATGAPVIAACFAGSVYIASLLSAGAGRTTDWEMTVRMDTPEHKIAEHMRRTAQHTLPARLGLSPPSQSSNSKQKLCYHRGLIGEGGAFRSGRGRGRERFRYRVEGLLAVSCCSPRMAARGSDLNSLLPG